MAFLGTFAATGKSTSRSEPRNTSAPGREILRLGFFNSRLIICINFCDTILTNNEYVVTVISVSEEEQVVNGCLASVSIDYVALGKVTGEMAVSVLKGEDASAMPVKTITEATPVINSTVLKKLGLSTPEGYSEVKTVE